MLELATTEELFGELAKRHKFACVYAYTDEQGPQYKVVRMCNTVELAGFSKIIDIFTEDYVRQTRV